MQILFFVISSLVKKQFLFEINQGSIIWLSENNPLDLPDADFIIYICVLISKKNLMELFVWLIDLASLQTFIEKRFF